MKLNELISQFTIAVSNEEARVLDKIKEVASYDSFPEREQFIIDSLIRKSLLSKINNNGKVLVVSNSVET